MKVIFGVFGALIVFVGLVLNSIPMLMGVSTDSEGKAAAVVRCLLVAACWITERYLLEAAPLPLGRSCACALVWFGSTLVAWAAPRPHDNISQGLGSQIAGCDGGYRSPFLIYCAMWITSLLFGTLLIGTLLLKCKEDATSEVHDVGDVESSFALRRGRISALAASGLMRGALPIIYAFATSMSGLVFAFGAARDEMSWVLLGAVLLVLAVLCAWISLWRLDLSLESWALLSQGFCSLLSLGQEHLVFRDFRWDPDSENGLLVVWKRPGLEMYLFGLLVLVATLLLFVASGDQDSRAHGSSFDHADGQSESGTRYPQAVPQRRYVWQWVLLPICFVSMVFGLSRPLVSTQVVWPRTQWVNGDESVNKFKNETGSGEVSGLTSERSYIDMIGEFYDKRLPCSALVVATNSAIYPPLQFAGLLTALVQPSFVPGAVLQTIRGELAKRALFRFTNPMYLMLFVSFLNLPGAGDVLFEALQFKASFEWGFWSLVVYCITSHILAQSLDPNADGVSSGEFQHGVPQHKGIRGTRGIVYPNGEDAKESSRELVKTVDHSRQYFLEHKISFDLDSQDSFSDSGSGEDESPGEPWLSVLGAAALVMFVGVAMYVGLTRPVLGFTYRVSGLKVSNLEPTLFDLWRSLSNSNHLLSFFAAFMFVFAMIVWVVLLAVVAVLGPNSGFVLVAERFMRPWVMGHVWALAIVVVYYISRSRSKAVIEYCAHFPDPHIGVAAILAMGVGVKLLLTKSEGILRQGRRHSSDNVLSQLPGGQFVWVIGPVVTAFAVVVCLDMFKSAVSPEISSLSDVNTMLEVYLPNANDRLQRWMPESAGDCDALTRYRTDHGMPAPAKELKDQDRQCAGSSPLVHVSQDNGGRDIDASALWVTGLNTLEVTDMRVLPPSKLSVSPQQWNMTFSGVFRSVHVWVKIDVGGKEWVNDYLCCDKPFRFVLQASTDCVEDSGFTPMELSIVDSDPIKFGHKWEDTTQDDWSSTSSSIEWDYGRQGLVEQELRKVITGKTGTLLVKTTSGAVIDALKSVSNLLTDVVKLNTRQLCPHNI
jgi:hypothetical protein